MNSKQLQALFVIFLASFAIYFSHLHFIHLWIGAIPLLGVLSFFDFPSLQFKNLKITSVFYFFGFVGLVAFLCSPLQNETDPAWKIYFTGALLLSAVGLLLSRWKKVFFGLFFPSLVFAFYFLTKRSQYPVLDVFASSGWNGTSWPFLLQSLTTLSFDVRYLHILFFGVGTLVLATLNSEKREISFFYLLSPAVLFFLERNWNDSLTALLMFLAWWGFQKKNPWIFSFFITALLVLMPEFILVLPPLIYASFHRFASRRWWVLSGMLLPAIIIWTLAILMDSSLAGFFETKLIANPLGNLNFVDWWTRFTGTTLGGWNIWLAVGAYVLLLWKWKKQKPAERTDFQNILFSMGFLSFACLDHLWFSLGFFFLSLALTTEFSTDSVTNLDLSWLFFLGTRFFLLFSWPLRFTDTFVYVRWAQKIFHHEWPYRQFNVEYPPLTLIPVLIPQFLTVWLRSNDELLPYRTFHSFLYFLFDAMVMFFLVRMQRRGRINSSGLFMYIVGGFIMGELLYDRLDLLIGISLMLGLYELLLENFFASWWSLILGVFVKVIPLIALPLLALKMLFSEKFHQKPISYLLKMFASLTALCFASWAIFGSAILNFMLPHEKRGIQIESTWASLAYCLNAIAPNTFAPVRILSNFGAFHMNNPSPILVRFAEWTAVPLLLTFYALCFWKLRKEKTLDWSKAFFITTLIFIVSCKVLSPQYLIWPICILPFCDYQFTKSSGARILILFLAALILTATSFHDYMRLLMLNEVLWQMVILRNLLLISVLVFAGFDFFTKPADLVSEKVQTPAS